MSSGLHGRHMTEIGDASTVLPSGTNLATGMQHEHWPCEYGTAAGSGDSRVDD